MKKKKIFILLGHPNDQTLTGAIADNYEAGALEAGHEVRRQNIADMQFDPILHKGYREIQDLEPDLKTFQKNVAWADHFVILHPRWWGAMPALLKGVFDRAWLPGFAFRFYKNGLGWEKLLKGKTARIVTLANTTPWISRVLFGDFTNELSRATLGFSGIRARCIIFSPSERAPEKTRKKWLKKIQKMGARAV